MTANAWRRHRALLLRSRGLTLETIGQQCGVSRTRAQQLICAGAFALLRRHRPDFYDPARPKIERGIVARALWLLRMRAFNRAVARRAYMMVREADRPSASTLDQP